MFKRLSISVLAVFIVLAGLTVACRFSVPSGAKTITPSGVVITETRDVSAFDRVVLSSLGEVTIIQGTTESLVIEADDNIMPYVETKVSAGTLSIGFADDTSLNFTGGTDLTLRFTLMVKDLSSLEVSGLASVTCDSLETGELNIGISGGGDIDLNSLATDSLVVNLSGLGDVNLSGQATSQEIKISGAGNYNAGDLESGTTSVTVSGLGDTTVWVTESLDVTISGAGSVKYYGNPSVSQNVSGLGDVMSLGAH